jgi:hypothetical protein
MSPQRVVESQPRRAACTIVAGNYLAQASVLAASLAEVHPELEMVTLLVDGDEPDRFLDGVGRVILAQDLGLDPDELNTMAAIYDVMEFSTALKARLLLLLLHEGFSSLAYFDPDIFVYSDLSEVFADAEHYGVALTPHALTPFPEDGLQVSRRDIMWAGVFNLGFIAVSSKAEPLLTWWDSRLRRDAISDPQNGLFTDQRWMDWAPTLSPVHVERDPGLNVAHWNLHERDVTHSHGSWRVGDGPLRFAHFSGYDPATPWLVTKHARDRPRIVFSERAELQELFDDYGRRLSVARERHPVERPYGYATTRSGVMMSAPLRRFYRDVLLGEVSTVIELPAVATKAFANWWSIPQFGTAVHALCAAEIALWRARPDLQTAFPDPLGRDAQRYVDWFSLDPGASAWLDASGLGPVKGDERGSFRRDGSLSVVVAGDPSGSDGRAAADLLADKLGGLPVVDASPVSGPAQVGLRDSTAIPTRLFLCLTASQSEGFQFPVPHGTTTVVVMFVEPSTLSPRALEALLSAEEVWAPTVRLASIAEELTGMPVRHISLGPSGRQITPKRGSPGTVTFAVARTPDAPDATIDAIAGYLASFPVSEPGVSLIVDSIDVDSQWFEWLTASTRQRDDIELRDVGRAAVDVVINLAVPRAWPLEHLLSIAQGRSVVAVDHPANLEVLSHAGADLIPLIDGAVDQSHLVRVLRAMVEHPGRAQRLVAVASESLVGPFPVVPIEREITS